jgi:hypothetical protein
MTTSKGKAKTVSGGTTIYGTLLRIESPSGMAQLRLPDDREFWLTAPADVLTSMAPRLGKEIGLHGSASWDIESLEMVAFRAAELSIYDPEARSLTEAFEALAEASQGRWEDVDADEYVRKVRYGIDPGPSTSSGDAPPGAAKP